MEAALTLDAVRVRSSGETGPAVRRAVVRQLEGAEIAPAGLPPSAVLIVRRLADPLPGRLRRRAHLPRPHPAWERAARGRLEELLRTAARPGRETVPAGAAAVLFSDRAELLATLATDLVAGRHRERWWWRAVLRDRPEVAGGGLAALLRGELERVPAVLTILHRRRRAVATVETLRPEQALERLHRLLPELGAGSRSGGPPGPSHEPPAPPGSDDALAGRHDRPRRPELGELVELTGAPTPGAAPWSTWWDDRGPRPAGREAHGLLGVALALHRAPSRARSPAFAAAVHRWWQAGSTGSSPAPDRPGEPGGPARRWPRAAPSGGAGGAGGARPARTARRDPRVSDGPGGAPSPLPPVRSTPPAPGGLRPADRPAEPAAETSAPTPAAAAETPAPFPDPEEGVETHLAGIFYLVGVMEDLDLLARLERVLHPADPVAGWGLLALLARALLADDGLPPGASADAAPRRPWQDDPLWAAFAALDGGEAEAPGAASLRPPLRAWIDGARQESARRLGEAGLDAGMLRAPGTVFVTSTHVDVVIPIDRISLPVRIAGLDRDSGWVPGLGRVVRFHFE